MMAVRVADCEPGAEVQVDFGRLAMLTGHNGIGVRSGDGPPPSAFHRESDEERAPPGSPAPGGIRDGQAWRASTAGMLQSTC